MSLPTLLVPFKLAPQENRLEGLIAFGFRAVYQPHLSAVSVAGLHLRIDNTPLMASIASS